jgi:hypothetical protein
MWFVDHAKFQIARGEGRVRQSKMAIGSHDGSISSRLDGHGELEPTDFTLTMTGHQNLQAGPLDPLPYAVRATITTIACQFHDGVPLQANFTRGLGIMQRARAREREFCETLEQARAITSARGNIRKRSDGRAGLYNRMPYFWAVVESLVGLR